MPVSRVAPGHLSNSYAFAYVLPCHTEELLKIGFSTNPIARFAAFHPRYYEIFDLDRGFLIETDRIDEARGVERDLMRDIDMHNAPCPLEVRTTAGGDTEWYRGVYTQVVEVATRVAEKLGYSLHAPLKSWLQARLAQKSDALFEWSANAIGIMAAENLDLRTDQDAKIFRAALVDRVDAYRSVGLNVESLVTAEFLAWYLETSGR